MTAARVLNPVVLSELCKIGASPSTMGLNLSCGSQLKRIKRDLFGSVNSSEINKLYNEEMEKQQEKAMKKWGFDFSNGSPVSNKKSSYLWERVSFKEAVFVPEVYTLTHAAHVRANNVMPTSMELLLDERAERENNSLLSSSATDTDSCDELQEDTEMVFKVPAVVNSAATPQTLTIRCGRSQQRRRQPKITEFMKERKRLAQTPKKISPPAKRQRTSSGSSNINSIHSSRNAESVLTRAAHAQQLSANLLLNK